jgi:hypothetical protein
MQKEHSMRSLRLLLCLICCSATFAWVSAARAQEGEFNVRAAIREGACDDRGDRIAALRNPDLPRGDEEGSRDGLSALVSETTIEVSIEDLIGDDSIIAITREGESGVDACGAIGGQLTRRDVLTIQVSEVDDSGVWGIAVLFPNDDDDEQTDVQLYLGGPGLEAAEPEPTQEPTKEPSNSPDNPNTGDGNLETITSPSFNFSLSYDDEVWNVANELETSPEGIETFALEAGFTTVYFSAIPSQVDAQQCVDVLANGQTGSENVTGSEPLEDENGEVIQGGNSNDAFAAYRLMRTADDGSEVAQAFYARCIVMVPGQSILAITQYSADVLYVLAEALRESLLEGLELP